MLKFIRPVLLIFSVFFLTFSLTSYAYSDSDGMSGDKIVHVKVAEPTMAPSATLFGRAISDITPGDLFYIDATTNPHDITINLYLTNAHELIPHLRYLILKVGIYFESSDGLWQKALLWNGNPVPDSFLTLSNSPVSFTLASGIKYKVTIDDGCFHCLPVKVNGASPSPQFYLTVEKA